MAYEIGQRIKRLREKAGLSETDLAERFGISRPSVFDLEEVEGELMIYSLKQALLLARTLGTSLLELIAPGTKNLRRVSFDEAAAMLRKRLEAGNKLEGLEDEVGWYLRDFLDDPTTAAMGESYSLQFLQDLGRVLNINWLCLLPGE